VGRGPGEGRRGRRTGYRGVRSLEQAGALVAAGGAEGVALAGGAPPRVLRDGGKGLAGVILAPERFKGH
jgi:hypothetical protein